MFWKGPHPAGHSPGLKAEPLSPTHGIVSEKRASIEGNKVVRIW